MTTEMTLSRRYQEVLGQVVADYIATAEAVGSRCVAKQLPYRLSPATIRNVLKGLEEMGYLHQPHTSAGRIPTEKGLRLYVDTFLERRPLSETEQIKIQEQYHLHEKDIRSLMHKTSKTLARLSKYVSLVVTPHLEKTRFKHIEFLPLSKGRLLGIFVFQTGVVENRILEIHEELNFRDLEKINNYCNACFFGLTLEEAREKLGKELTRAHQEYDRLTRKALLFSQELFGASSPSELVVDGEAQLLGTKAFSTLSQIKELLESLEEKQQLLTILNSCLESPGVRIFIGAESLSPATKDLSLITSTYAQGDHLLGTIGVIGPTSMDYGKVIAIVDFTAKLVGNLIDQGLKS